AVPPLADYDAVVIGGRGGFGGHPRAILDYIREHRSALDDMPASFFTLRRHRGGSRDASVERTTHRTGWAPGPARAVADASERQRPDVASFAREISDAVPIADHPTTL